MFEKFLYLNYLGPWAAMVVNAVVYKYTAIKPTVGEVLSPTTRVEEGIVTHENNACEHGEHAMSCIQLNFSWVPSSKLLLDCSHSMPSPLTLVPQKWDGSK